MEYYQLSMQKWIIRDNCGHWWWQSMKLVSAEVDKDMNVSLPKWQLDILVSHKPIPSCPAQEWDGNSLEEDK